MSNSPPASIVIPAYNEAARIQSVLEDLSEDYEVLVVDDASSDATAAVARQAGARVLRNESNAGYIHSLQRGFKAATGEIIVTMDGDGEHRAADVPRLVEPVRSGEYDVVFGARKTIPRPSERFLNRLARIRVDISDTGTGFRALRTELARSLALRTACTCGTFALEAKYRGATLGEVPIETAKVSKPRGVAWVHGRQLGHVLRWLLKTCNRP